MKKGKIKFAGEIRIFIVLLLLCLAFYGYGQSSENADCQQQVELLRKELSDSKSEYQKLLETKTVVVVKKKEPVDPDAKRQIIIGMNMTSMLSRLVPFGNGIPLAGPTTLMLRKQQGNKAFRIGIGLNTRNDIDFFNASVRIGMEKKKELNSRFVFIRGTDAILAAGSFNMPGFRLTEQSAAFLGGLLSLGLEYRLEKNISLGTETLLMAGLQGGNRAILGFQIVPPIALYLHAALN